VSEPSEIARLRVEVDMLKRERDSLRDLREAQYVTIEGEPCTCGSGAHPRKCRQHPNGFAAHVGQINYECALEDRAELAEAKVASLTAALEAADKLRASLGPPVYHVDWCVVCDTLVSNVAPHRDDCTLAVYDLARRGER
jgi:hypothetical protein